MDKKQTDKYAVLTQQEYAKVFSTFIRNSTEYRAMQSLIAPIIDSFGGRPVKLLSIGAGTGCFEESLLNNCGLKLKYAYAIEPNSSHLVELKKTISKWDIDYVVDSNYFTPEIEIEDTFDIIFMSHCMYCMEDPLSAMMKAKSLLNTDGSVIIFNQSENGGYELYSHLMQNAGLDGVPINDHSISSKELTNMLKESGVNHVIYENPSTLGVDDFVKKRNTPTANDVVTFFLQTRFETLSDTLKTEIYNMTKERCIVDSDGRNVFYHPTAMIQICNSSTQPTG